MTRFVANHTAKVIIHISDHNHNRPESDKLMPIHPHKYALRRNTLCSLIQPSRKSIEPFVELLFLVVNVLPLGLFCNLLVFFSRNFDSKYANDPHTSLPCSLDGSSERAVYV